MYKRTSYDLEVKYRKGPTYIVFIQLGVPFMNIKYYRFITTTNNLQTCHTLPFICGVKEYI